MNAKITIQLICLIFTFGLSQSFVVAETNDKEKHIVINESKTYKDTEITLEHLMISQDKITLQLQLHGEQVKDLILNKKGNVHVHAAPKVIVLDENGLTLKSGAKKEDNPNKGSFISGRVHNISANAIEIASYFETKEQLPKVLTIKVMELSKEQKKIGNNPIAEFKVHL